jgi:DNA-binding transcriptional LysR family regulator
MTDDAEIDLNLMLALGALLEDRNLTRAGERIGMSQPAMSAALARLRRHFGDDLLEREGRGYRRTVFGEQLLPTVREALRQMDATMQRSPRFDPAESDREFSIAASDYTVSILADPLLRLVKQAAPRIRLNLHSLPPSLPSSGAALAIEDLLIGPVGYDFPGRRLELFRDRFVCVADPVAAGLTGAALTLEDLSRMPHAAPTFAPGSHTPVDRVLEEFGVTPHVQVTVFGWLSVPFVLAGTGMVAIMPERMARLAIRSVRLAIFEPPFGRVELVEAAYWHPSRSDDPAVRWLLKTLQDAARGLLYSRVRHESFGIAPTSGSAAAGGRRPASSRVFPRRCCSMPATAPISWWWAAAGTAGSPRRCSARSASTACITRTVPSS